MTPVKGARGRAPPCRPGCGDPRVMFVDILLVVVACLRGHRRPIEVDRRSTTASKSSPRVLYACLCAFGPLAKHLQCPQIRALHRSSTPKISPGAQKKPLHLLPRQRHHGVPARPEPPAVRGRSRVRAHLSRTQPKQSASSTDCRQITPRRSRLSPFMPISSARPDQGS